MKTLLLIIGLFIVSTSANSQCSVSINDSLLTDYTYILNATNIVGQGPFQFNWTVTDGNGVPIPFTQNTVGDSVIIASQTVQDAYGCIIYHLCMVDDTNCTSCPQADTSSLQVPFGCYSAFTTNSLGFNQYAITINSNIPPFIILTQFLQWTNGDGQAQGAPYTGAGTQITYLPGAQNTSNKFLLCLVSQLSTGGCISCDSILYDPVAGIAEKKISLFKIHPNPANNIITIEGKNAIKTISVLETTGKVLKRIKVGAGKNIQLSLADFPNGMYFLRIETSQGVAMNRISVQH